MKTRYIFLICLGILIGDRPSAFAQDDLATLKQRDTTFYSTFFKDEVYESSLGALEPLRLGRDLTFHKPNALDINRYDEVVDNSFFSNRQGKKPLSAAELLNAPLKTQDPGPSLEGTWKILKGKTDGVTPGFLIEDSKGDKFLLKFDPRSNPEMATSAEMIVHKLFYAFGYNVPSYSLVLFSPDILTVDPKATYYTKKGFKKPLTKEKTLEMLKKDAVLFVGGKYRASASRILKGPLLGYVEYDQKFKKDPEDLLPHDRMRSFRALQIFGAWTNNYDLHRKNTMATVVDENGKQIVKHYLIDFGSSLGSSGFRPKVPVIGFENVVDFKEILKAIGLLKVQQKPWEKRWDKNEQTITQTNLGYFDNKEFNPGTWKPNLPHYAFRYMTATDAYWAAKILSKFTDEDIRTAVKAGGLSDKHAEGVLANTLIERRDIIVRYWFGKVSPLENFSVQESPEGFQIKFDDLSALKGWAPQRSYAYKAYALEGKKKRLIQKASNLPAGFAIPKSASEKILLEIRAIDGKKKGPAVKAIFETKSPQKILEIEH